MSNDERVESVDGDDVATAVVLDFLPRGRSDDDRPRYGRSPVAFAVGVSDFRLHEMRLDDDTDVSIGDTVTVSPRDDESDILELNEVDYDDLSGGAQSELDYAVADIVDDNESRFVDFFNDAQPITLRLHQLNLLPGIGKKLRNDILDERERAPFESFEDLEDRISGLHDPRQVLIDRILEEVRDEELKYRSFVATS